MVMRQGLITATLAALTLGADGAWSAPLEAPAVARPEAAAALLDRAKLWEGRLRDDLVWDTLNRLLNVAPDHAEGLAMLVRLQLRNDDVDAARDALNRLRRTHPQHPLLPKLEALFKVSRNDNAKLRQVRQLARAGKSEQAVVALRQLFPGGPPEGDLGVEYWDLLGGTPSGWEEARAGLARLVADNPDDPRYRLALAELILRRQPTHAESLRTLRQLASQPQVSRQARAAWRRALLRLDPTPASVPLLREYLAEESGDSAMQERYASAVQLAETQRRLLADPYYRAKLEGLTLLDRNDLLGAETKLIDAIAQRPDDADGLGGWGMLRLRQGHHAEAEAYFRQALVKEKDPNQKSKWQNLITTARFWGLLRVADDASDSREYALAEAKIREAMPLDPKSPYALLALGRLREIQGLPEHAEINYRKALSLAPANAGALGGLLRLLVKTNRSDAADALLNTLTPTQRKALGDELGSLRAGLLRDQADQLLAAKRPDAALELLAQAARLAPDDPWVMFDRARLLARRGQTGEANALVEATLARRPTDATLRYAAALYHSGDNRDALALRTLAPIPPAARSGAITELQRRLWLEVQLAEVERRRQQGEQAAAGRVLSAASQAIGDDPALWPAIARAWLTLGERSTASQLATALAAHLAQARAQLGDAAALNGDSALALAELYSRLGDDAAFSRWLADLRQHAGSPARQAELQALQLSHARRRAEELAAAGDLDAALRLLDTSLASAPDSERYALLRATAEVLHEQQRWDDALAYWQQAERQAEQHAGTSAEQPARQREVALGRLTTWVAAGRAGAALPAIETLLAQATPPLTADEQAQLIGQLATLGEDGLVASELTRLLAAQPRHVRGLQLAGQLARRQGRYADALAYMQRALSARQQAANTLLGGSAPLAAPLRSPLAQLRLVPGSSSELPTLQLQRPTPTTPAPAPASTPPSPVSTGWFAPPPPAALAVPGGSGDQRALAELLDLGAPWLNGAFDRRSRQGVEGKSRYLSEEVTLEWKQPGGLFGREGQLFGRVDGVRVDAGRLNLAGTDAQTYGSVLFCGALCTGKNASQASGIALNAGFANDQLRLDLGTTPLGFPVVNVIGGALYKGDLGGPWSYSVDLSRRPVTGTVLSYAGAVDPASGRKWGGVTATGGRLGLSRDDGGANGLWASLGLHQLSGKNVQDNNRLQLMGGVYHRLINEDNRQFTVGLTAMHWRHSRNAGEYTFGHGGYYSPATYSSLSLPLSFGQRYTRFSWLVRAAISYSRSTTAAADYFPTDRNYQALATQLAAATPLTALPNLSNPAFIGIAPGPQPQYTAGSGQGVGRSLHGAWEYQVEPQWFIGGRLEMERAVDYTPNRLLFYFRYNTERSAAQPVALPPLPVQPTSQF